MASTMLYRKLNHGELHLINNLLDRFCEEIGADEDVREAMGTNIARGYTKVFIAENGIVCGAVGYIPIGSVATGEFLYVYPEKRKGIVGGRLFKTAVMDAIKHECKKIRIIVSLKNTKLYSKLGYRPAYQVLEKEVNDG